MCVCVCVLPLYLGPMKKGGPGTHYSGGTLSGHGIGMQVMWDSWIAFCFYILLYSEVVEVTVTDQSDEDVKLMNDGEDVSEEDLDKTDDEHG